MDKLARKILELTEFKNEFNKILYASVLGTLPETLAREDASQIDWSYMLLCGSFLAQAESAECQDAALRIAQHCLSASNQSEYRAAAAVLLSTLTNKPAIELAIEKDLLSEDYENSIPRPLLLEKMWRDQLHTFEVAGKSKYLNKFQRNFLLASEEQVVVSASAPTSAGKSYVLGLIVARALSNSNSPRRIVYIVPTRALINEVEDKFNESFADYGLNKSIYISSIPKLPSQQHIQKNQLFIFTQERLHWFLTDNPEYRIDMLIVDEAQKIGDGQRGILLQEKVEQLQKINQHIKILFSSAFSQNPEVLLGIPSQNSGISLRTDYVAVNQNLIWLSKTPRKAKEWQILLCLKTHSIPLGKIILQQPASSPIVQSGILPIALGSDTGNLVYANGPAFAERIAANIANTLRSNGVARDENTFEGLLDLSKRLIHPHYSLTEVLPYGVAFHYGNMPLLVRREIERLFREGRIKYLVCTSTLLEGVNLSAKSIFITNPTRGRTSPMSEADFWNLAGRAGRLSKDFQGNIFCIEPETWEHKPLWGERRYKIKKSLTEITGDGIEFTDFVEKHIADKEARQENFEYALSYFYLKYLDEDYSAIFSEKLMAQLAEIKAQVELPKEIFQRNPGISPMAMQRLLQYFTDHEKPQELLPPKTVASENAVRDYAKIVARVNSYLVPSRKTISQNREALLAVVWMRGYPLPRIIIDYFTFLKNAGADPKLPTVIRDTMRNIEDDIRFGFAKYITCYLDVLRYFYNKVGRDDLINLLPDVRMWVEFGVSETTQINLINLGLSRHVAIELSKIIGDTNFTEAACVKWINELDLRVVELPQSFVMEIQKVKQQLEH